MFLTFSLYFNSSLKRYIFHKWTFWVLIAIDRKVYYLKTNWETYIPKYLEHFLLAYILSYVEKTMLILWYFNRRKPETIATFKETVARTDF